MRRALVNRTLSLTPSSERGLDGRLLADYNDNKAATMSGSVPTSNRVDINENLTTYNLLPELINYPPYFETSVFDASEPVVKPMQFNEEDRNVMYYDDGGTIKVLNGASFLIRCKAQQPPIYNVENGKPTILHDTVVPFDTNRQEVPENVQVRRLEVTR